MRVLHWYPNFFAGGGVANAVLGLAVSQARLGAEVAVAAATPSGPPLYETMSGGGAVTLVEWRPRWTVRAQGCLLRGVPHDAARRLQAAAPDVVHIHGEFNPDNFWVPRLFTCPVIVSPHGTFHPEVIRKSRRAAKRVYLAAARRMLYRRVGAFHALSAFEAEYVRRLVPGGRVYCAPQGPNVLAAAVATGERPRPWDGAVRLAFVGRLDIYTKGLDLLLEAFADAGRRVPGAGLELMLVGPEWRGSLTWLQRRAQVLGVAPRVRFAGALTASQVAAALREADVYIQLSRHEGFPLSVSEALLVGKPAILSAAVGPVAYAEIAALPHVRVVPPSAQEAADAVVEFVRRLPELQQAAERSLPEVREFFSWERAARLHLEAYDHELRAHDRRADP